jgi:DNA-directed RNA polymerase subunit RPC12/RpoP
MLTKSLFWLPYKTLNHYKCTNCQNAIIEELEETDQVICKWETCWKLLINKEYQ